MNAIKQDVFAHKRLIHGSEPVIIQVYADKGTDAKPRVLHGTLNQVGPAIDQAVQSGSAVAIGLNTFRDGKRTSENVVRINGFFLDLDGGVTLDDIKNFPLPPHLVTETSPGHFHVFWRVTGCPIAAFAAIQKILAERLGGDPKVFDLARTMRLAGTYNRKNGIDHQVQIVSIKTGDDAKPIAFQAFLRAFDIKPKKISAPKPHHPIANAPDTADIQEALSKIAADDRLTWLHVGMALHSIYPNTEGKALWDRWSQKASDKFDQREQDRAWSGFKPRGGITKGTLFHLAGMYSTAGKIDVPSNESEFAKLFVETYKGEAAFDHQTLSWFMFDDIWKKAPHLALRRCKAMVDGIVEVVRSCNPDGRNGLLKAVQRHTTTPSLANILKHASLDEAIEISSAKFDDNAELLGVPNGVVELNTGRHRAARADDFITLQCRAPYDKTATCPTFIAFIDSTTEGDEKFASFLQRALGYSIFGHTKEQVFFMITGPGANGKGVLLRTVARVLDKYATNVAPNLLQRAYSGNPNGPSPAVMALKSARMYICSEFDGQKRFDDAFVKQLSGSDTLTGRSNFGDQETFEPMGKLWLSLNFDPEIAHDNEAMWRRLRVVPFLRSFTGKDRDNDLEAKLTAELPGILNWLIEGARMYARNGLGDCAKVHDATAKLRERSDTVLSWFRACCVKRDTVNIQGATEVYKSYVGHTRADNRSPLPMPKFNGGLQRLGGQRVRRSTSNGWKGFLLRSD